VRRAALRLARSSTLRLALLYLTLFIASVVTLFGLFFWSTAGFLARQTDATIQAEIEGLDERYRLAGLAGLTGLIEERVRRDPGRSSVYLLADRGFRPVAGNLSGWPRDGTDAGDWLEFGIRVPGPEGELPHWARARHFTLRGGFHLLVGRDVQDLVEVRERMLRTFAWGLGIAVLLGAAGGVWMSRRFVGRIERINQTSRGIMRGDLSLRIPGDGGGDELDELARHWNQMLDRIETLMAGVRQVSDNIAHDLRTPLARLRNELELARDAAKDSERRHLDTAIAEADALLSTFAALLRIARIEAGERRAGFAPCDLAGLLRDVTELYEPLAEERGQRIHRVLESGVHVLGDRDLLFQAFANLLDNAVKYSPEGGEIRLGLHRGERAGDRVARVTIADSGPGIAPEYRDRVLERFFRLEKSRSTPGNGLGLSLVAAVARLHGARLELGDASPGLLVTVDLEPAEPSAADLAAVPHAGLAREGQL